MKKILSATLTLTLAASMLAGCGGSSTAAPAAPAAAETEAAETEAAAPETQAPAAEAEEDAYDPEIYYNDGGFNVPGITFQPAKPDTVGSRFEPVEVFKNVYFIGDTWVCCMLYVTDQGNIIMWDALEGIVDIEDILLPDMEKLGLDISKITDCFLSHGHFDHVGFSGYLEQEYGTQIYISPEDEELMLSNAERFSNPDYDGPVTPLPENYEFYTDGDTFTKDNVTFTFMHTPGHTDGSMSFFVPVEGFDGSQHILSCWGGTSAPRDPEGTQVYLGSVASFRDYVSANNVDAFLSMHPFVDYSTDNVAIVRETGSSDALVKTPEQMDFFLWTLDVYTRMKGKLAQSGITEFQHEGYGSKVLAMPYIVYIPEEDTGNGSRHLEDAVCSEIFDDVYLIGNGTDATMVFNSTDGIVLVDAMTSTDDFTDIVEPAFAELGLDPANIKAVMLTHGHADKYGFASYLQETYGAKVYMSSADNDTAANAYADAVAAGKVTTVPTADEDLAAGTMTFGQFNFNWYATPGHTPGTMSFTVNVGDHVAACWGGTTYVYEDEAMANYVASIGSFIEACKNDGADALISSHPYFNYEVEKIEEMATTGENTFVLADPATVEFTLRCVEAAAQYKLTYIDRYK